ncbi:MAG: hypothetical protein R2712_09505 [Vicinamibacterales bacterium]
MFGDRTIAADFVFEGGNLAFDRIGSRTRVFIGYNDVRLTIENHARQGHEMSVDDVRGLVSEDFGGAEVVVVGRQQQSPLLFHLDQAFTLLDGQVAVVNRIVGPASPEQRQLQATESQLKALGYRRLPSSTRAGRRRRLPGSTNAVPFVDAATGRRRSSSRSSGR